MAEKRSRRRFTAEFKAQAVRRLLDGGRGLSEVATELGLSTGQLSTWRVEHLAAARMVTPCMLARASAGVRSPRPECKR
jgi:transposase